MRPLAFPMYLMRAHLLVLSASSMDGPAVDAWGYYYELDYTGEAILQTEIQWVGYSLYLHHSYISHFNAEVKSNVKT